MTATAAHARSSPTVAAARAPPAATAASRHAASSASNASRSRPGGGVAPAPPPARSRIVSATPLRHASAGKVAAGTSAAALRSAESAARRVAMLAFGAAAAYASALETEGETKPAAI